MTLPEGPLASPQDPEALRAALFEAASQAYDEMETVHTTHPWEQTRDEVLAQVPRPDPPQPAPRPLRPPVARVPRGGSAETSGPPPATTATVPAPETSAPDIDRLVWTDDDAVFGATSPPASVPGPAPSRPISTPPPAPPRSPSFPPPPPTRAAPTFSPPPRTPPGSPVPPWATAPPPPSPPPRLRTPPPAITAPPLPPPAPPRSPAAPPRRPGRPPAAGPIAHAATLEGRTRPARPAPATAAGAAASAAAGAWRPARTAPPAPAAHHHHGPAPSRDVGRRIGPISWATSWLATRMPMTPPARTRREGWERTPLTARVLSRLGDAALYGHVAYAAVSGVFRAIPDARFSSIGEAMDFFGMFHSGPDARPTTPPDIQQPPSILDNHDGSWPGDTHKPAASNMLSEQIEQLIEQGDELLEDLATLEIKSGHTELDSLLADPELHITGAEQKALLQNEELMAALLANGIVLPGSDADHIVVNWNQTRVDDGGNHYLPPLATKLIRSELETLRQSTNT